MIMWIFCLPKGIHRPALVAIAAILSVTFFVIVGLVSANPSAPASARALDEFATSAVHQPTDLTGTANDYRYLKSEGSDLNVFLGRNNQRFAILVPKTRELWVAQDGSGRIRETLGSPVFLSEIDHASWLAAGLSSLDYAMNRDFEPGGLSYEDFTRFPTDPDALADIIRSQADSPSGAPVNVEMFTIIGDLLREPGAPAQVCSALFKVASEVEGVELVGNVIDRRGRRGVALAMTSNHSGAKQRLTLIFDPVSAKLLEEETVLLDHADWIDAKPPIVIGYTTYLESAIVTKLP